MKQRNIIFNGKFLEAGPTGVHRVAEQLIRGVDDLLASQSAYDRYWTLLIPKNVTPRIPLRNIAVNAKGLLTWQFWEQFELPWFSRKSLLVNLCNLAPLASRGGITMIHDAQVFISPQSYSWGFRTWYRFVLPRIGARATRILTVSNYSLEKLVEFGIAPADKISVIYNGIDHSSMEGADPGCLQRLGLLPSTYAVALASIQKHKNIKLLLEAFARPEMAAIKLVLVGGGGRAPFTNNAFSLPPNIVFAGHVSDSELRALYEGAICFAFPSTTEGFGLPPLEAMHAGCPAVVAPCGALVEVCGQAAIYRAPDDDAAWADAILALAHDEALRKERVEKGRVQAAQFTWERAARQLLDIILKTAGDG